MSLKDIRCARECMRGQFAQARFVLRSVRARSDIATSIDK
jgi:hypothetical protein